MKSATPSATAGDYATLAPSQWIHVECAPPDYTPATRVRVLFEDANLLAVEKPAGIVTHPAYRHPDGTLCDAVFTLQAAQGKRRPWLLHRLDRETSGVVLFAKTEQARRAVVRQFERHTVRKRYLALVNGAPDPLDGVIEAPLARDPSDRRRVIVALDGKPSTTDYRVVASIADHALVVAEPRTGRTHQIRAHLALLGAPIAGDRQYQPGHSTGAGAAGRTMLHAWKITIRYPGTGEPFTVTAPPPADFLAAAERIGLGSSLASCIKEAP